MAKTPDTIMLFAAGRGTRMAPLTDMCPKPLIRVAGRALLDHALDLVDRAGLPRVVVNSHYLGDQIRAHLSDRPQIMISEERDALLDTGGGLRHAMPLLERDVVFTLNTDAIWTGPDPFAPLIGAWDPDRMDALLLLVPPGQALGHKGQGDFQMDAAGRLIRGSGLVYSGLQIVSTAGLDRFADAAFSLNLHWNEIARAGRLFGTVYSGRWCDVGQADSIVLAERMLAEKPRV